MRVLARFLDALVLGASGALLAVILLRSGDDAGFAGLGADASFARTYSIGLLGVAVGFVWDAVCTKLFGGTPMKKAFGLRVVRADTGGPVEWRHAILRWAVPGAFSVIPIPLVAGLAGLVVQIVSLVLLFSRPLRQCVWDQVGTTLVVRGR